MSEQEQKLWPQEEDAPETRTETAPAVAEAEALISMTGRVIPFVRLALPDTEARLDIGVYREIDPNGNVLTTPEHMIFEVYGDEGQYLVGVRVDGELFFASEYNKNEVARAFWGSLSSFIDQQIEIGGGPLEEEEEEPQEEAEEAGPSFKRLIAGGVNGASETIPDPATGEA